MDSVGTSASTTIQIRKCLVHIVINHIDSGHCAINVHPPWLEWKHQHYVMVDDVIATVTVMPATYIDSVHRRLHHGNNHDCMLDC